MTKSGEEADESPLRIALSEDWKSRYSLSNIVKDNSLNSISKRFNSIAFQWKFYLSFKSTYFWNSFIRKFTRIRCHLMLSGISLKSAKIKTSIHRRLYWRSGVTEIKKSFLMDFRLLFSMISNYILLSNNWYHNLHLGSKLMVLLKTQQCFSGVF